jgi:o-succinylbenzoate synthase
MIKALYRKKVLQFRNPTETSRGVLQQKPSWYVFLYDDQEPEIKGIGECSIIPGLSLETEEKVDGVLEQICCRINAGNFDFQTGLPDFPSLYFGIEMALLDLKTGGKKQLFPSAFTEGKSCIPINGLIWMGKMSYILQQIEEKINQHFSCLKLKIGALNIENELKILESVRKRFNARELELRVDANGAFEPEFAMELLKKLADLEVHSIEQPIKPGQPEAMARLCMNSPVPVALDEELSGKFTIEEKFAIIQHIHPQYLIIKPGLLGGFQEANEYVTLAREENIGWWITSALESNIGLNAIAQWTFTLGSSRFQGLGTGQLYHHNIDCPLTLEGDKLFYYPGKGWDLSFIE